MLPTYGLDLFNPTTMAKIELYEAYSEKVRQFLLNLTEYLIADDLEVGEIIQLGEELKRFHEDGPKDSSLTYRDAVNLYKIHQLMEANVDINGKDEGFSIEDFREAYKLLHSKYPATWRAIEVWVYG